MWMMIACQGVRPPTMRRRILHDRRHIYPTIGRHVLHTILRAPRHHYRRRRREPRVCGRGPLGKGAPFTVPPPEIYDQSHHRQDWRPPPSREADPRSWRLWQQPGPRGGLKITTANTEIGVTLARWRRSPVAWSGGGVNV